MEADDFQDLYKLIRGNRAAAAVTDAQSLFMEKRMVEAHTKLLFAHEAYLESRSRTIKQDIAKQVDPKAKDAEKQIQKLQRKRDKVLDGVKKFEELIPRMEKLANREREKQEKRAAAESVESTPKESTEESASISEQQESRDANPSDGEAAVTEGTAEPKPDALGSSEIARPADLSDEFIAAFEASDGETQMDVIFSAFDFLEVQTEEDIHGDALYYIRTSDSGYLVRTPNADQMEETITLVMVVDDRSIKPFKRSKFLKLGKTRKMVLLTQKQPEQESEQEPGLEPASESSKEPAEPVAPSSGADKDDKDDEAKPSPGNVIDMAAFSQLLTAAQRSGVVTGADQIGHIRDREFQQGKFDQAFQAIDSIFSRFTASASQRAQRLRQEDADIANGRLKISPKELLAKRARDRAQTQEIDRAQRRFQVVIEGLRVLMKNS